MKIAGFDIGGANTDLAVVDFDENGSIKDIETGFEYLPMWKDKKELSQVLLDLLGRELSDIQAVGVCMTAELVDAYQTKSEGVLDIACKVMDTFNLPIGFVGLNGLIDYNQLQWNPSQVAAANWIATSRLAAKINPNCIMIDTGSTTTDIIPLKNGLECAKGRSDLQRLQTGELVYTGTLRTNVATIVDKVPLDNSWVRVASELFAISADAHLLLGNIKIDDYNCETPDGAGKSRNDCMRRISRVICSDLDTLSFRNIMDISKFIVEKQVEQVSEALMEVSIMNEIFNVVTTGLGMNVIGAAACELVDIPWLSMDELISEEECIVAPAVGTAVLMEEFLRL
ncbi:MAG: hydantoinase/oxoprolinase family protein [Methanobacterium sp.]|jgi:probable H4MPT-linked C1 transfer pathway protein